MAQFCNILLMTCFLEWWIGQHKVSLPIDTNVLYIENRQIIDDKSVYCNLLQMIQHLGNLIYTNQRFGILLQMIQHLAYLILMNQHLGSLLQMIQHLSNLIHSNQHLATLLQMIQHLAYLIHTNQHLGTLLQMIKHLGSISILPQMTEHSSESALN